MESPNVSFNISAAPSALISSTPFKIPLARKPAKGRPKTFVRPVCDTCPECGKEYRCHRSFLNHRRQHSIKDASSKVPDVTAIVKHCTESVFEAIKDISCNVLCTPFSEKYSLFLNGLLAKEEDLSKAKEWDTFMKIVHESMTEDLEMKKVLMPNAILNVLVKNCEELLSAVQKRQELCETLLDCSVVNSDANTCQIFIADYVYSTVKRILKFFCASLKEGVTSTTTVQQVILGHEELETVHFVSGAVLRQFYRKAELFPKNVGWQAIAAVITSRLLQSEFVPGPPEVVQGWTKSKNKGKLFFVSAGVFNFFVGVAEILEATSLNAKVRVDKEKVLEAVCERGLVLIWDDAVGDHLGDKASYEFMCGMVKSFCDTYGAGKLRRVLNAIRPNKAEANIQLRHAVAPRT